MNTVEHRPGRFTLTVDGADCVLDYFEQDGVLHFHHTGVHSALQGQGLAAQLVKAGLQWAASQGKKVAPDCSYVAAYMQRHACWRELL